MVPPMGYQQPQHNQGYPHFHPENTQNGGRGRGRGGRGGKGGGRGKGVGRGRGKCGKPQYYPQERQQHHNSQMESSDNRYRYLEAIVTATQQKLADTDKRLAETEKQLATTQKMVEDLMKMQGQGQAPPQAPDQAPAQTPAQATGQATAHATVQAPPQATVQAPPQASDKSWESQAVAPPSKGQASAKGQAPATSKKVKKGKPVYGIDPRGGTFGISGARKGGDKKGGVTIYYTPPGFSKGWPLGQVTVEQNERHVWLGGKQQNAAGHACWTRLTLTAELVEEVTEVQTWQDIINGSIAEEEAKMQEAFLASLEE
tara:strand:+ start:2642 stop:3586 length:945 start_codon:yes stop_codon:yes gene_type:complete